MTYEERERIFSKEILNQKDIMALFEICQSEASVLMTTIKRWAKENNTLRLEIKGKLHVQDYLDYFGITNFERYKKDNSIGVISNLT